MLILVWELIKVFSLQSLCSLIGVTHHYTLNFPSCVSVKCTHKDAKAQAQARAQAHCNINVLFLLLLNQSKSVHSPRLSEKKNIGSPSFVSLFPVLFVFFLSFLSFSRSLLSSCSSDRRSFHVASLSFKCIRIRAHRLCTTNIRCKRPTSRLAMWTEDRHLVIHIIIRSRTPSTHQAMTTSLSCNRRCLRVPQVPLVLEA